MTPPDAHTISRHQSLRTNRKGSDNSRCVNSESTCGRYCIIPQRFRYLHLFIHTAPPARAAVRQRRGGAAAEVHCGGNLDWLRETGLILPVPIDTPQVAIDALATSVLHLAVSSRRPKWSVFARRGRRRRIHRALDYGGARAGACSQNGFRGKRSIWVSCMTFVQPCLRRARLWI
jgi:hypothetical protein